MSSSVTAQIQSCLLQLEAGEPAARDRLIECACERLRKLTAKMLRSYPRLKRWEETDDVFVNAMIRLSKALAATTPSSALHFFRLAAVQIRRVLLDLSRNYFGPQGHGAKHETQQLDSESEPQRPGEASPDVTFEPGRLVSWSDFHEAVEQLPEDQREVFELLWYHELPQTEAAELLEVDRRTVIRRWQAACLQLHDRLGGELPG